MSTYTPIASIQLNQAVSSFTFSSVPQGYSDLILVTDGLSQPAGGGACNLRFNGDTGSNYSYAYMFGSGSGTGTGRFSNTSVIPTNRHNATDGGTGTAHIMGYSNPNIQKTVISRGGGNNISIIYTGTWRNTAPITSITCVMESGPGFAVGFTATLYGIALGNTLQKAQGGNIVVSDGTYMYHAFTSSGAFVPSQSLSADVLVVAGGGGSGRTGGGGGAGGLRGLTSQSLSSGVLYPVVIGAGGASAVNDDGFAATGSNSSFGSISASGGGGGASFSNSLTVTGKPGGSGGGAGCSDNGIAGRTGGAGNVGGYSPAEGFAGGNSTVNRGGGGGGGAVAAGTAATTAGTGGAGGNGSGSYSSWGSATQLGILTSGTYYFAGGGGGSGTSAGGAAGLGGTAGGTLGSGAKNGAVNTGAGAGSNNDENGYTGGSGIVIVRYAI